MKKIIKLLIVVMSLCLACGCICGCGGDDGEVVKSGDVSADSTDTASEYKTDCEFTAYATIDVKDYGKIKVGLAGKEAPITVENFIKLAKDKFYDGLTFHRIMSGFVIQGGDPEGNGTGGSGKTIKGEFKENGVNNPLSHKRGAISMARNGFDMNSADSQFFIVHDDAAIPSLDGKYACFGYVTEGIEVVDKICEKAKPTDNNGTIPAAEQPIINSVIISDK